jgi:hypothetical protein
VSAANKAASREGPCSTNARLGSRLARTVRDLRALSLSARTVELRTTHSATIGIP